MFSERSRQMDHPLFVLWAIKRQSLFMSKLGYALTESRDIAVTKDSPNPFDKPILTAVPFNKLSSQKTRESLAGGESDIAIHSENDKLEMADDRRSDCAQSSLLSVRVLSRWLLIRFISLIECSLLESSGFNGLTAEAVLNRVGFPAQS
jgi:hypothetical protein